MVLSRLGSDLLQPPRSQFIENRKLAVLPSTSLLSADPKLFFTKMSAFVADNFPFRKVFIGWHHRTRIALFARSPVKAVSLGRSNWLFLRDHDIEINYDPKHGFSETELQQFSKMFKRRRQTLSDQGVEYLVAIVPNKHSIYPQYLPADFPKSRLFFQDGSVSQVPNREH